MQSSLIPERPLIVSPTLAATIGLEEAVMLHVLSERLSHGGRTANDGMDWVELDQQTLMEALPFWAMIDIRRVQKSLQDLGLILVKAASGRDDCWCFAINQQGVRTGQEPAQSARTPRRSGSAGPGASYIPPNWEPSREWIEKCRQHNIPEAFVRSRVEEFVLYWRERGQSRFSWGNAFYKHVLREWRQEQSRQGFSQQEAPMSPDWWPSAEAQDILVNAGVSRDFIEDAVPEFVLYWRERGVAHSAWNSKFIEHIRRQWAKYATALSRDSTPRPIPEDWEPSPEVYEILRLAEIDEDFARRKLPEFILYWRDAGQAQSSWNTRFLQYIKYSWARQLNGLSGVRHEGHQASAENGRQGVEAAYRRFTDRSWAD
ncbi:MAG: DnaT-like ssDNA-binding domain-containing protein [Pseudomonadota bacterium]